MKRVKSLPLFRWLATAALLLSFLTVQAGLIIEISGDIDVSSVKALRIEGNNLIVIYGANEQTTITLPAGGMDNLLLWVKQSCSGPFVISVDGALVPGGGTYTSPCFPPSLAQAMIDYDVYAHAFAQGEIPVDSMLHPLILKTGNVSLMPHAQYGWLMDPKNQSPNALWYRNLMSRFPSEPDVIGEFTIKAIPSRRGFPVKIKASSYLSFRPNLWYRTVTAASEFDNATFDLPYAPLKKDIETRFDAYRKNFKPFDELASFVEAYALLKKISEKKPDLWEQLLKAKCRNKEKDCIIASSIYRQNGPKSAWNYDWDAEFTWAEWSTGSLGETIETSQEADLALCHLWDSNETDLDYSEIIGWEEGIERMGEKDMDIKAKYLLYQFKNQKEPADREELADEFLSLTRQNKKLLRLRIVGCQKMLDMENAEWLTNLVAEEREKITQDFVAAVDALKKRQGESNDDFLGWEDLSQTVYSTGLLSFLGDDGYSRYPAEFARALAYMHYRRGLAFQPVDEVAYQHAHFRYLGYLSRNLDTERDAKLIKDIFDYRAKLASRMGIKGWNEADFEDAFYGDFDDPEDENLISSNPTKEPWRTAPMVEGELMGADALFLGKNKNTPLPQDGSPVGLRSQDGTFTLLLLDSGVFSTVKKTSKTLVRAYGITYNGLKAMTPLRVEIKGKSGEWEVLDIPHSGTAERGIFNGQ